MCGSDQLPQQPRQLVCKEKHHPQSDEGNGHLIHCFTLVNPHVTRLFVALQSFSDVEQLH